MSNKLKTLSVYDEGLGFVDELCDDIDFVLAAEDTFVIFPEDEFFEFNFDNFISSSLTTLFLSFSFLIISLLLLV